MNVLKPHEKNTVEALLERKKSQHEIHRLTGIDRKTIRKYERAWKEGPPDLISNSPRVATGCAPGETQNPPPRPPDGTASYEVAAPAQTMPAHARSACEPHREWIEKQVRLKRNAQAIFQDLVDLHSFKAKYNSVKRFVRGLRREDPEQFDRLEFLPGEEAQVDYGEGAPTLDPKSGRYRRPRLFVMTLRYSRRSFRKVVWKSSKETWCRLHEEAFRYFGGCPQYVVLDNLREGVIKPDIYEPQLNRLYEAMLNHYGVMADPARICDPNRKGSVENAIQHTQSTALKGRKFEAIEAQNEFLLHWEEKWAAPRIHGRAKRQVEAMFQEEKPHLRTLPVAPFRYFQDGTRTVGDDTTIQVEGSSYAARPAPIGSIVLVRVYDLTIEIRDLNTQDLIRSHPRATTPGTLRLPEKERPFNPSRQTAFLLTKAKEIGPSTHELCGQLFEQHGRVGQKSMWGIVGLTNRYPARIVESACRLALDRNVRSSKQVRLIADSVFEEALAKLEQASVSAPAPETRLTQNDPLIRDVVEYDEFFNQSARARAGFTDSAGAHNPPAPAGQPKEKTDDHVHARNGAMPEAAQALRNSSDAGDENCPGTGLQSELFGNLLDDPAGRARPPAHAPNRATLSAVGS